MTAMTRAAVIPSREIETILLEVSCLFFKIPILRCLFYLLFFLSKQPIKSMYLFFFFFFFILNVCFAPTYLFNTDFLGTVLFARLFVCCCSWWFVFPHLLFLSLSVSLFFFDVSSLEEFWIDCHSCVRVSTLVSVFGLSASIFFCSLSFSFSFAFRVRFLPSCPC